MNQNYYSHIKKDPVCGMKINPNTAGYDFIWNDETYYFCAEHCQEAFEKSPDKYLKKRSWLRKTWDRYLLRLGKKTGGKSLRCH